MPEFKHLQQNISIEFNIILHIIAQIQENNMNYIIATTMMSPILCIYKIYFLNELFLYACCVVWVWNLVSDFEGGT
jgi:Ca2+/Na+ antiporter